MQVYLAGPLFTPAERGALAELARRLRAEGFDCFVPHEHFDELDEPTPAGVYRLDGNGLRASQLLLATLDGPIVDDGTAAEIGIFAELVRSRGAEYRGLVGLVRDLRLERRRGKAPGDGLNLFVAGAITAHGRICWSLDEAVAALHELAGPRTLPESSHSVHDRTAG